MNQIPQVDFHIPNRILLFLNFLSQLFQIDFVLQEGFGILLVQLLKRFQIGSGLLLTYVALFAQKGNYTGKIRIHKSTSDRYSLHRCVYRHTLHTVNYIT